MSVIGYIPKTICIVKSDPKPINRTWDQVKIPNLEAEKLSVVHICDATNSSAITKAERAIMREHPDFYSRNAHRNIPPPQKVIKENTPVTGLELYTVSDYYSNSHGVFKIRTRENYLVDLKEDILLETCLTTGIESGAKLPGEYIWACIGYRLRLVRIGSELHDLLLRSTERRVMKGLTWKQIKPGFIYANRRNDLLLFLGKFNTKITDFVRSNNPASYSLVDYRLRQTDLQNVPLWFCFPQPTTDFQNQFQLNQGYLKNYKIRKSTSSIVEEIGSVQLTPGFEVSIRNQCIKEAKEQIIKAKEAWSRRYLLSKYSPLTNLYLQGTPQPSDVLYNIITTMI